jgi:hypothetical protein
MVVGVSFPDSPLAGIGNSILSDTHEVWWLTAPGSASLYTIAGLIALFTINAAEPFLETQLMPTTHCPVYLYRDGDVRYGRGNRLATWALEEFKRITIRLLTDHSAYLGSVAAGLQRAPGIFKPLPPGFVFDDPLRVCRVGPAPPEVKVDVRVPRQLRSTRRWDEIVRLDYRRNRYLEHLTDDQLGKRAEDILGNMLSVKDQARRVPLNYHDPVGKYWASRFAEVLGEIEFRHGKYPEGWHRGRVDFSNMPASVQKLGSPVVTTLRTSTPLDEPYLVKYGERRFLEPALKTGKLRVSAAASYADPSLTAAIRDDELQTQVDFDPNALGLGGGPWRGPSRGSGRIMVDKQLSTNFYVYCLAARLLPRLLGDFNADACLVIRDPNAFINRVADAMAAHLPGWDATVGYVEYYDPLQVNPAEVRQPFWKHFRFAYQHEIRLVWMPPAPEIVLSRIELNLGSLDDIAELVLPDVKT